MLIAYYWVAKKFIWVFLDHIMEKPKRTIWTVQHIFLEAFLQEFQPYSYEVIICSQHMHLNIIYILTLPGLSFLLQVFPHSTIFLLILMSYNTYGSFTFLCEHLLVFFCDFFTDFLSLKVLLKPEICKYWVLPSLSLTFKYLPL